MALLEYSEITEKKYIVMDGQPFEVISAHVFRKQQRKPVNATKLKNLMTGKVTEYSFHVSDKVEEAEIESREVKYLYNNRGEWWFNEAEDPSKRTGAEGAGRHPWDRPRRREEGEPPQLEVARLPGPLQRPRLPARRRRPAGELHAVYYRG